MVAALAIDAIVGDPDVVWRRIPHPVALIGKLIAVLDGALNRGAARRAKGVLAVVFLVAVSGGIGYAIAELGNWIVESICAALLLAQNSLYRHFNAVREPLARGDLAGARAALAMIVGRDVTALDES